MIAGKIGEYGPVEGNLVDPTLTEGVGAHFHGDRVSAALTEHTQMLL